MQKAYFSFLSFDFDRSHFRFKDSRVMRLLPALLGAERELVTVIGTNAVSLSKVLSRDTHWRLDLLIDESLPKTVLQLVWYTELGITQEHCTSKPTTNYLIISVQTGMCDDCPKKKHKQSCLFINSQIGPGQVEHQIEHHTRHAAPCSYSQSHLLEPLRLNHKLFPVK